MSDFRAFEPEPSYVEPEPSYAPLWYSRHLATVRIMATTPGPGSARPAASPSKAVGIPGDPDQDDSPVILIKSWSLAGQTPGPAFNTPGDQLLNRKTKARPPPAPRHQPLSHRGAAP